MNNDFAFTIKRIRFDENYNPSKNTRATTNFANLARGEKRQENLRNALVMIDNRLTRWRTGTIQRLTAIPLNWSSFLRS